MDQRSMDSLIIGMKSTQLYNNIMFSNEDDKLYIYELLNSFKGSLKLIILV